MKLTDDEKTLFFSPQTSLDDLKAAGYRIESNGFCTFFRHDSRRVVSYPFWVSQLIDSARRLADENAKRNVRIALGLEDGTKPPETAKLAEAAS